MESGDTAAQRTGRSGRRRIGPRGRVASSGSRRFGSLSVLLPPPARGHRPGRLPRATPAALARGRQPGGALAGLAAAGGAPAGAPLPPPAAPVRAAHRGGAAGPLAAGPSVQPPPTAGGAARGGLQRARSEAAAAPWPAASPRRQPAGGGDLGRHPAGWTCMAWVPAPPAAARPPWGRWPSGGTAASAAARSWPRRLSSAPVWAVARWAVRRRRSAPRRAAAAGHGRSARAGRARPVPAPAAGALPVGEGGGALVDHHQHVGCCSTLEGFWPAALLLPATAP